MCLSVCVCVAGRDARVATSFDSIVHLNNFSQARSRFNCTPESRSVPTESVSVVVANPWNLISRHTHTHAHTPPSPGDDESGRGRHVSSPWSTPTTVAVDPVELAERLASDMCAVGLEVIVGTTTSARSALTAYKWGGSGNTQSAPLPPLPTDPVLWASAVVCIVGVGPIPMPTDASECRDDLDDHYDAAESDALSKFDDVLARAVGRVDEGLLLLLPVRCVSSANDELEVPPALRRRFFRDFSSTHDYYHNMIRRGAVPGLLTEVAGLGGSELFDKHCIK